MQGNPAGRAMAESILPGTCRTIDLTRLGWRRIVDGTPLPERGII